MGPWVRPWMRPAQRAGLAALLLTGFGCAARGGLDLPDAAAIAAGERARAAIEQERGLYPDEDLAAELGRIAEPVLEAGLAALDPRASASAVGRGWRLAVLDDPEPEALLFADRSVFLTRGALVALDGVAGFEALMGVAASRFGGGGFRAARGEALVEQPLSLPLAEQPLSLSLPLVEQSQSPTLPLTAPETRPAPVEESAPSRPEADPAEWIDLLAGLVYGHRPEFGAAVGARLLLPVADLQLALPGGRRFVADGRRRFRAAAGEQESLDPSLTVREMALPEGEPPVDGSLAGERDLFDRLAARIAVDAEAAGKQATLAEVVRVRGFPGVRARWRDGLAAFGFVAILRTPGAWVELAAECAQASFVECEAAFLGLLGTADRLWDEPAPGPLRLRTREVERPGPGREVIRRLAATSEAPVGELLRVNHAWLDREFAVGDRVLVLERDPAAGPAPASGPTSPPTSSGESPP